MIKQGEVAFLKTTGEAVYVLGFSDLSPKIGDKELVVEVRRPVMGQDGVRHVKEFFQLGELESLDDQRDRYIQEQAEREKKLGLSKQQAPSDIGFPIN